MFDLHRKLFGWMQAAQLRSRLLLGLLGLAAAVPASAGEPPPALRHGEIASADAFHARLPPDAIVSARIALDATKVPAELRSLVPLAEYWGIGDDVIRDVLQESESQAQKAALAKAVNPHNAVITAWLDSLPAGQPMSDEAAAFMYMQLGLEEMGLFEAD